MNEILNQKFGVEVEMYNLTRAKAAQVVQQTLTALTGETWNVTLPGAHLDERKIFPMSDGRLSDRCWKIESDASIQARNTYERTELVSPVLTWEQMPLSSKSSATCVRLERRATQHTSAVSTSMWMGQGTLRKRY